MTSRSAQLIVASNRGPLTVVGVEDGEDVIRRGSGGLVSGMQAALSATPDAVWVCAAMNDRERAMTRQASNGRLSGLPEVAEALNGDFDVRMLPIDAQTFRAAYNGVANSTLWFVLHQLYELPKQPNFDANWRRQWAAYVRFNRAFAQALADEAADGAMVMVQDYHLFLVPRMLRDLRPELKISIFTHTPWVSPDYFSMLPDDVGHALVDGMLGADVVGFHTQRWAQLFTDTARAVLGKEPSGV
jgi:trehalose 6-phosphate synthase